jgi:hypothetical protein
MDEFVRSKPTDNRSLILISDQNYLNKIEKIQIDTISPLAKKTP